MFVIMQDGYPISCTEGTYNEVLQGLLKDQAKLALETRAGELIDSTLYKDKNGYWVRTEYAKHRVCLRYADMLLVAEVGELLDRRAHYDLV